MRLCRKCNKTYDHTWKVCLICGEPLISEDGTVIQPEETSNKEGGGVLPKVKRFFRETFIGDTPKSEKSEASGSGFRWHGAPKEAYSPWKVSVRDSISPILGIDLGTTSSLVGTIFHNSPYIVKNKYGDDREPSYVVITTKGGLIVGADAKKTLGTPDVVGYTIGSIKRKLGNVSGTVIINNKKFYPQVVSALLLSHLKKQAEAHFNTKFEKAVIAVPANFNAHQRESVKEAAELAGLIPIRIVNEAVAASLCYAYSASGHSDRTILVVDFGGGTLDVTLVTISGINQDVCLEVHTTSGDSKLGGDDFTDILRDHIIKCCKEKYGKGIKQSHINQTRLWEAAENAKIELSSSPTTNIMIPYIEDEGGAFVTVEIEIARSVFEELVRSLVDKMEGCVKSVIELSKLDKQHIDETVIIGGTSRIPSVVNRIRALVGDKISASKNANPENAVAIGAIIMGGIIGGSANALVLDIMPKSIGLGLDDYKFDKMIERGSTLPTRHSKEFTTTKDNQEAIDVLIYEGESSDVRKNDLLMNFRLDNIPRATKGVPKIEVSFEVDQNGLIKVTATDLGTARQKSEIINLYTTLTKDEKEKIKRNISDWAEFNKMFSL